MQWKHAQLSWLHRLWEIGWQDTAGAAESSQTETSSVKGYFLPRVLWPCWMGDRKGIRPVKIGFWFVCGDNMTAAFACLIALVVITTSIILSSNNSRMESFWYRLTQVHLENWPIKWPSNHAKENKRLSLTWSFPLLKGSDVPTKVRGTWEQLNWRDRESLCQENYPALLYVSIEFFSKADVLKMAQTSAVNHAWKTVQQGNVPVHCACLLTIVSEWLTLLEPFLQCSNMVGWVEGHLAYK